MSCRHPLALLWLVLAAAPTPAQGGEAPEAPGAPLPVRLEFAQSPLLELYCEVRVLAEERSDPPPDTPLARAVAAARALGRELPGWGLIEGLLGGCEDAAELVSRWETLPETFRSRGGAEIELRQPALELAHAVAALEPDWLRDEWPKREPTLREGVAALQATFTPALQDAVFADVSKALELELSEPLVVPVCVVGRAPWPGAFTHRQRGGTGICFVDLTYEPASLLAESVIHESIHALDLATAEGSLLARLRTALAESGVPPPRVRDAVHTLFFLLAADVVRAHVDSEHVDYGDAKGYYAKVPSVIELERALWPRYRSGAIDSDALIAGLVEGLRGEGR